MMANAPPLHPSLAAPVWLAIRIWWWALAVQARMRREPLPRLVADPGGPRRLRARRYPWPWCGDHVPMARYS
jgi:hypothetical protein